VTIYLTGEPNEDVVKGSSSDEVIFLGYSSHDVRGLKLGAIKKIRSIVAARDFLFCIAHRAKPTYVALLATNLPVISVRHNYGDFDRFSRRILVNFFRKRLLILGVSDSVRDEIRSHLPKWPSHQIETLYNRIDVELTQSEFFSKEEARSILDLPENAWVVGNVGRLHHDKDQATLLRGFQKALPELPSNSLLVIMGSGPLETQLKQLANELDIQSSVIFTGNVPNAKKYFKAFDVFALTSDHEPFGMVLLEAMAAGLPLVCSDCGGGAEVVARIGQLFPLGNVSDLASCLIFQYQNNIDFDSSVEIKKLLNCFSDYAAAERFWLLAFVEDFEHKMN
jgi:glycosyltransferase involved in cell wall biosynthesis